MQMNELPAKTTPSRFDYVKYDEKAGSKSKIFYDLYKAIDGVIEKSLKNSRPKALAQTALEESFMWIGKAIRDDQVERTHTPPLAP